MLVRERRDTDLVTVENLALDVHRQDGYPLYLPTDLRSFLYSRDALAAWVAVDQPGIVGHVALHTRSWDGVMELTQEATGLTDGECSVVARLMVSPNGRRQGIGAALLEAAEGHARRLGLRAILDVAVQYTAAIALYERHGWIRLGSVSFPLPNGRTVDEYVYLGPE